MILITNLRSKRQQELQKKLELTATTTTQAQKQEMIAGSLKMSPRNSSNQSNALSSVGTVKARHSETGIRTCDLSMHTNDPNALPTELPF